MSLSGFLVELSTLVGISPADSLHSSESKISPPQLHHLVPEPLEYAEGVVHRWDSMVFTNGKAAWSVVLVKEGNQLKYRLENRQGYSSTDDIPVPFPLSTDQLIKGLIERAEPVVEYVSKHMPLITFSFTYREQLLPRETEGQVRRVRLLKGGFDWYWQKWDSITQLRVYIPLHLTIPSELCTKDARKRVVDLSRAKITDSLAEISKFSCIDFHQRPVSVLVEKPKFDTPPEKKQLEIPCKAKIQIDSKGKVTIHVTDRDLMPFDTSGRTGTSTFSWYSGNPKDITLAYPTEEGGSTKWIFITRYTIYENPWRSVIPLYTANVTGQPYDKAFQIELTPKEVLQRVLPYVHETKCTQTFHVKKVSTQPEEDLYTIDSPFELSFPIEPKLQFPRQEITCLELEPTFALSCFDETVPITHFQWGFTLIASSGSQGNNVPSSLQNNHAIGALELLNDGIYPELPLHQIVRVLFHFTGEKIKMKVVDKFDWFERSQVFPVDPAKGKELIAALGQALKEPPPAFNVRGIKALFSSGHSCITWMQEYLKIINVDFGTNWIGLLGTRTKNWTDEKHQPQNGSL